MAPEDLNQAVIDFLNSARTTKKLTRCSCGVMREHQKTKFFYNGQSWEVELPVCPKCSATSVTHVADA